MKSIILTTIFSVIAIIANAQADKIDSLLNDLLSNDKKVTRLLEPQNSFLVLYAGTSVENQTFYAGREIGDKQTFYAGRVIIDNI